MALFNAAENESSWVRSQLCTPPYPLPKAASFLSLPFEARVKQAGEDTVAHGLFPAYPYLYHTARVAIFVAVPGLLFNYSSTDVDFAFKKLIVWAILLEICGFSTMSGPLGSDGQIFDALWFRTKTGTVKQPLLTFLPRKRSLLDVILFVLFVSCCVTIVFFITQQLLAFRICCSLHTVLCCMDRTAFTGAMGAYYYPLLFCLCFEDWAVGCQLVQFAHLFMAGICKFGPWFPEVTPSMVAMCPLVPKSLRTICFTPDFKPNTLAIVLSFGGAAAELISPVLLCCPTKELRFTGMALACGFHGYILLMCPIGAILEWNLVNLVAELFLFVHKFPDTQEFLLSHCITHCAPWLLLPILLAEFGAPLVGNLKPRWLSNHFTLRKYTGNHPYHTFLLRKAAAHKLTRAALPTPRPIHIRVTTEETDLRAAFLEDAALHSITRGRLNAKPLLPLLRRAAELAGDGDGHDDDSDGQGSSTPQREAQRARSQSRGREKRAKAPAPGVSVGGSSSADGCAGTAKATPDDFVRVGAAFLLGQTMLDVSFIDAPLLAELRRSCGFSRGDLLSVTIYSFPTFSFRHGCGAGTYEAEWEISDVADVSDRESSIPVKAAGVVRYRMGREVELRENTKVASS